MDYRTFNLSFNDGRSIYGLCFTMGTNEFLGGNGNYEFV